MEKGTDRMAAAAPAPAAASQCRSPRCTAERRGVRRELDSWRHRLMHCVGKRGGGAGPRGGRARGARELPPAGGLRAGLRLGAAGGVGAERPLPGSGPFVLACAGCPLLSPAAPGWGIRPVLAPLRRNRSCADGWDLKFSLPPASCHGDGRSPLAAPSPRLPR